MKFDGFKFNSKQVLTNAVEKVLLLRDPDDIVDEHLYYIVNANTEEELRETLFNFYWDVEENTIKHELTNDVEEKLERLEMYKEEPCNCDGCCDFD